MVTIITKAKLKDGAEREWDAAMRDRMARAAKQPGWIRGQLLKPEDEPDTRVIVGTWRARRDWQKWHGDPRFAETRRRLDDLVAGPETHAWHVGIIDAAPGRGTGTSGKASGRRQTGSRERTGRSRSTGTRGRAAGVRSGGRQGRSRAQGGRSAASGRRTR